MGSFAPVLLYLLAAIGPAPQLTDSQEQLVGLAAALTSDAADFVDQEVPLPRLQWVDADRAEQAWLKLKSMDSPASQAAAIRRGGVEQYACKGLVDFRDIAERYGATLDFRDQFRGRSWARPALARVLLRASERFAEEFPDARLTLGDIAQPGCGQLAYGTLIRHVVNEPGSPAARDLLARVRRVLGEPMAIEVKNSTDFPFESDRFDKPTAILVERKILGVSGAGRDPDLVRVAVRRFAPDPLPSQRRRAQRLIAAMLRSARHLVETGELVRHEAVRTFDPRTGDDRLAFLQHRVDRKKGMQVLVISTHAFGDRLQEDSLVELRVARWRPGKPESFGSETRWRPVRDGSQHIVGWDRWHMLGEAGHVTHLGGRDIDISYVTRTNAGLNRVKVRQIDAARSWRWFQIVSETAAAYGTPVEQIFVGPRTVAWLRKHLPKAARETALWRDTVQTMPGHDAHHHLRLRPPTAADDAHALAELRGDPVSTARR